jgi:hypothetical protein
VGDFLERQSMKNTIQILHVTQRTGLSQKTGKPYDMRSAQCIVHKVNRDTGVVEPMIGELMLPERFKETKPGTYEVEFEVSIDKDKRVGAQVATMVSVVEGGSKTPAAKAA